MSISQFNAMYDNQQDRILFRFNTHKQEEYRFWLTRFMTMKLIQTIEGLNQKKIETKHNPQIAQVIQEFQADAVQKTTNLKETFQAEKNFPLGPSPILITGFSVQAKGEAFAFSLQLDGDKKLGFHVLDKVTQSLIFLLKKTAVEKAQWNLMTEPAIAPPSEQHVTLVDSKKIH